MAMTGKSLPKAKAEPKPAQAAAKSDQVHVVVAAASQHIFFLPEIDIPFPDTAPKPGIGEAHVTAQR